MTNNKLDLRTKRKIRDLKRKIAFFEESLLKFELKKYSLYENIDECFKEIYKIVKSTDADFV